MLKRDERNAKCVAHGHDFGGGADGAADFCERCGAPNPLCPPAWLCPVCLRCSERPQDASVSTCAGSLTMETEHEPVAMVTAAVMRWAT